MTNFPFKQWAQENEIAFNEDEEEAIQFRRWALNKGMVPARIIAHTWPAHKVLPGGA